MSADIELYEQLAAEHRHLVRTIWASLAVWCVAGVVLVVVALSVPASVGLLIAAVLMLGPLVALAFRRR